MSDTDSSHNLGQLNMFAIENRENFLRVRGFAQNGVGRAAVVGDMADWPPLPFEHVQNLADVG